MDWEAIKMIASELAIVLSFAVPVYVWGKKIVEGQRCQLREAMLRIYYKNKDSQTISQYEAEHFDKCYHAYKALNGNSFIDEIYNKAHKWEVVI